MAHLPHLPVTSASCSCADHECVLVVNELALCVNPCKLSPKLDWQTWFTSCHLAGPNHSKGELSRVLVQWVHCTTAASGQARCLVSSASNSNSFLQHASRASGSASLRLDCVLETGRSTEKNIRKTENHFVRKS